MRKLFLFVLCSSFCALLRAAIGLGGIGGAGGTATPSGSDEQPQFNDHGSFGAISNPLYDKSGHLLDFGKPGFVMTDPNGCQWGVIINVSGAAVTSFIGCPPPAFVACQPGTPVGLLLALTCPNGNSAPGSGGRGMGLLMGLTYSN